MLSRQWVGQLKISRHYCLFFIIIIIIVISYLPTLSRGMVAKNSDKMINRFAVFFFLPLLPFVRDSWGKLWSEFSFSSPIYVYTLAPDGTRQNTQKMIIALIFLFVRAQHVNESIITRLYFMEIFSAERGISGVLSSKTDHWSVI